MTIFNKYTRRNKVVKSIQFELVPEGRTKETMEQLKFEEKDASFREIADNLVPYIDDVIRMIANHALSNFTYDFTNLENKADLEKSLEKQLTSSADELFGIKIKDINSAKFINQVLPNYIETQNFSKEEREDALRLVEAAKGKTAFISPFLITRITALTTWLPARVLENLEIYKKNVVVFTKLFASELGPTLKESLNVDHFDELSYYDSILSQDQIDAYNQTINGVVREDGIETKGVRMIVNEYNIQNKDASLPMPKELYKQILMPSKAAFVIETIKTDDELRTIVFGSNETVLDASAKIIDALKDVSLDDIVVTYNQLHHLSYVVTGDHNTIPVAIREEKLNVLQEQFDHATTTKERRQITKKIDSITKDLSKNEWTLREIESISNCSGILDTYYNTILNTCSHIKQFYDELVLSVPSIRESKESIASLKAYFDVCTELRQLLTIVRRKGTDKGNHILYAVLEDEMQRLRVSAKAETLIVSYVTRKPKDVAKKELATMGTATRTNSQWIQPDGKMNINTHTILKRNGKYYYLILSPGTKPVLLLGEEGSGSEIFAQKKAQNAMQFLPRISFTRAKSYFEEHPEESEFVLTEKFSRPIVISRSLMEIKDNNLYTVGAMKNGIVTENEYKENLYQILSFYKELIESYEEYSLFNIQLKEDLHEYRDSGEFFDDVNASNSTAIWIPANTKLIDEMIENGSALMFLIHSRNLYTPKEKKSSYDQLFLAAMTDTSKDVYLNSNPKLFSRKASVKEPIIHKIGSILVNRIDANGNRIPDDVYEELYRYYNDKIGSSVMVLSDESKYYIQNNLVVKKKATKEIVKDKRYTEDKWFVQFSFTKNRSVAHAAKGLNDEIRTTIHERNILTIIRSETDLIYYTITAPNGDVLEKRSLNTIQNRDFWKELKEISNERKSEKSNNWKYDKKVKEQRDAYLKLAISVLVRKVIEYDAIVVLERISQEVKDKFSAMDNQTMKSFESMLINRLSDLFFLDVPIGEPGSVTNPYQLCDNTGSEFQDGIVFFVSPTYTGNVDSTTGFVNVFNLSNIGTISAKKMFLSKFDCISYDKDKNRFVFKFDYDNFSTRLNLNQTKWTVLAGGEKTVFDREKKRNMYVNETISSVLDILAKKDRCVEENLAMLAFDGSMTTEETNALYDIFETSIRSVIKAHDDEPKTYVSPVTEEKVPYNENAAMNLTRKFLFTQDQLVLDKNEKEDWVNRIKI